MTEDSISLCCPAELTPAMNTYLEGLARRNDQEHGADLLGLVLTGSAGRGIPTERSDLDVNVVLTDAGIRNRETTRSVAVDEIPISISELGRVAAFGTPGWWSRWSFAWAPVLLDRTEGLLSSALRRQATLTTEETESILVEHDRLDGWINFAYRALKNQRDGRLLECRLDAAESIPWLLDLLFSLNRRVRPYNKYLPWELREHPLPQWDAGELLGLLAATLDGDPSAIRKTFARVESLCTAFDDARSAPLLTPIVLDWGGELRMLRG